MPFVQRVGAGPADVQRRAGRGIQETRPKNATDSTKPPTPFRPQLFGLAWSDLAVWEVFAGVGNLTKAVVERLVFLGVSPEKVGPPVDVKRSRDGAPQLCLDLLDPSCQSFIWRLLREVAPNISILGLLAPSSF